MAILYDLFLFIIFHCALAGKYSVYGNIRKIMFCEYFIDFHIGSEAKHRWNTCEIYMVARNIDINRTTRTRSGSGTENISLKIFLAHKVWLFIVSWVNIIQYVPQKQH